MAHQYQSLNFTHEEVDGLLSKVASWIDNEKRLLTADEYKQLTEALRFLHEFDGNYDNLINKPSIPVNISQLKNDVGFTTINLESIKDWVMMCIDEAELGYEENYVTENTMHNLYNDVYDRLKTDINEMENRIKARYATKDQIKGLEYELEPHKHEAHDIGSAIRDSEVYTIADDLKDLNKNVIDYKNKTKEYSNSLVDTKHKINELKNSIDTYSTYSKNQFKKLNEKVEKKAERDHTHDEFSLIQHIEQHDHLNKVVLDVIDSGSLAKWNTVVKFVGNVETISLNGMDQQSFLEGWKNANNKTTTIDVGGVPQGSNLEGKSLYEIIKMMFYPDNGPTLEIEMVPTELNFEIGLENPAVIQSITATVIPGTNPIKNIKLFVDGIQKDIKIDVADGGTFTFNIDESIYSEKRATVESKYKVRVEDEIGLGAEAVAPAINFYYPMFYGVLEQDIDIYTVLESDIINQTKIVSDKVNKTLTYTAKNQKMFYAYPSEYDLLNKITDTNGFNITNTFDITNIDLPINGSIINYYVYISNVNSNTNFDITYRFDKEGEGNE